MLLGDSICILYKSICPLAFDVAINADVEEGEEFGFVGGVNVEAIDRSETLLTLGTGLVIIEDLTLLE